MNIPNPFASLGYPFLQAVLLLILSRR